MDRRTYESPMDWEYQNNGPLDPTSPFVQSTKKFPSQNIFASSNTSNNYNNNSNKKNPSFGQSPFHRTQSTTSPSKPLPPTPPHQPSIFSTSTPQRTTTAPPFRNPAFTTPRKPFDVDALSEFSAAESSPAVTDASDYPDTPENDHSFDMARMTITPSTFNKHKTVSSKKASGKGEIPKTVFASRDKVRKRKRYNANQDISGYRMPYIQPDECDESDYESDESTYQPNNPRKDQTNHNDRDGWVGSFLGVIQRHPYAPSILGYWLTFAFNLFCVSAACWVGWSIIDGLRSDFNTERGVERAKLLARIQMCQNSYKDNKCWPLEQRIPAVYDKCDEWHACMQENPDVVKQISTGAKEMARLISETIDAMSYKAIILFVLLFAIFIFSGRSLYKSTNAFSDIPQPHPPTPFPSQHAGGQHAGPSSQHIYWQAIPQTPRRAHDRRFLANGETPDTDEAPPKFQALPPPETPGSRRSPSKGERGRSPAKSRSPSKRH
ncbi:Di-sulfide bridge nucleocytoplasmic transport domain-containing protein [Hypoxylon sp. NC1633]|nr:Di-sulfide bridge nucleocytoplasmic transport domain-containing protein [Hypoxylon sp. NC1633]